VVSVSYTHLIGQLGMVVLRMVVPHGGVEGVCVCVCEGLGVYTWGV
jgi:hypothetical protein